MTNQVYSFSFDASKDITFPEQAYSLEMVGEGTQMILMVGLPNIESYTKGPKNDPLAMLQNIFNHKKRSNSRYQPRYTSGGFRQNLRQYWTPEDYRYYEIHMDLGQRPKDQIAHFAQDKKFTPTRLQMSHDELNDVLVHKENNGLISRDLKNLQKFDHLFTQANARSAQFCLDRIVENAGSYSDKPQDSMALSTLSMGERIAFSMGFSTRRAVTDYALGKNDFEENIPLMTKVFHPQGKGYDFATLARTEEMKQAGESVNRCVPFTDLLSNPAAYLNRIQIQNYLDNKECLFDEQGLKETAEWLNAHWSNSSRQKNKV